MSLRAGRAALAEDVGSEAATPWCWSDRGAVLCGDDDQSMMDGEVIIAVQICARRNLFVSTDLIFYMKSVVYYG